MKKNILIYITSLALILTACVKEKANEKNVIAPTCAPVSFATDVLPIFQARCNSIGCHHSSTSSDGIALTTHIEASSADEARLLGAIKHDGGFDAMPQGGGSLSTDEINKIECWIIDGKKNN